MGTVLVSLINTDRRRAPGVRDGEQMRKKQDDPRQIYGREKTAPRTRKNSRLDTGGCTYWIAWKEEEGKGPLCPGGRRKRRGTSQELRGQNRKIMATRGPTDLSGYPLVGKGNRESGRPIHRGRVGVVFLPRKSTDAIQI